MQKQSRKKNRKGYINNSSLDEKVMLAIVSTSELFKKEQGLVFKNYGLTFPQYNVLRILDDSPGGQNAITNVGRIMLVSGANMTGIAKRLEKNGFLIRKGDASDERVKILEITPKGRQTLKNASGEKDGNINKYLNGFSVDEKKEILAKLKQIRGR